MKKVLFIFIFMFLAFMPNATYANSLNRFFVIPKKVDTKILQNKCSNSCLSSYSDILRCSSAKIIMEDLIQNDLIEDDYKN